MENSIQKIAEVQAEKVLESRREAFAKATEANRLEMFKRWLETGLQSNTPEPNDPKTGLVAQFAQFMGLEEPRWEAKDSYIADGNIIYLFSIK